MSNFDSNIWIFGFLFFLSFPTSPKDRENMLVEVNVYVIKRIEHGYDHISERHEK